MLNSLNPTKVALFDLDGTLADFDRQMRIDLERLMSPGEKMPESIGSGEPWFKARKNLIKRQPGWWSSLPPFGLGWNILAMAERIGFQPHILTKGPYNTTSAWTEKVEWVRRHFPHIPVTITEDKGMVYGRVLVDDWPPYIAAWLAHRPRGLVIVPAQPWNTGNELARITHGPESTIIRYDGNNGGEVEDAMVLAYEREP